MSKITTTALFMFVSLLFLSACGENSSTTAGVDKPTDLFEYEQRTLDQAKALEESLKKSLDRKLGSLE